jgi:hypothetical protein
VEDVVEQTSELGVVVAKHESGRQFPIVQVHRGVPGLLGDPCRVGVGRNSGEDDSPGAEVDEEQHVQRLEPDRLHREEIAGHDHLGL